MNKYAKDFLRKETSKGELDPVNMNTSHKATYIKIQIDKLMSRTEWRNQKMF